MASMESQIKSPLIEAPLQESESSTTKDAQVVKNEGDDLEVPTFTDEDIDTIFQDIDEEVDTKLDSPGISMSLIQENPVNETGDPAQKIHNPVVDEPANSTEIDAIQKHVEESLLFLDNDKVASNLSEQMDGGVDLKPIKEIVWETSKCENETDVPDENIEMDESLEPSTVPQDDGISKITDQELSTTDIPDEMDQDIESSVQESPQILPALELVEEPVVSVEHANHATEPPEEKKMDEDLKNNVYEPPQISSLQGLETDVIPMKQPQNESEVSDTMGVNDNSVNLEQSNVENNKDHVENTSPENIHTNVDAEPKEENVLDVLPVKQSHEFEVSDTGGENSNSVSLEQSNVENNMDHVENTCAKNIHTNVYDEPKEENFLDSPLSEQQQTYKKQNLQISSLPETSLESLPLDSAQNETNEVTEKMGTKENTIQLEPLSAATQVDLESNSSMDHAQKETSADLMINDRFICLQSELKNDQDNPISSEIVKETGDCKDLVDKPTTDVTDGSNFEEKVDKNVILVPSEIREESIQESVISSSRDKEMKEEIVDDKTDKSQVETSRVDLQQSVYNQKLTENYGKTEASHSKDEIITSQIQKNVTKLVDINIEAKVEKMDENQDNIPSKVIPTQITNKQENGGETNPVLEKGIKESEPNEKSLDTNVNLKQAGIDIKREIVETTVPSKAEQENQNPKTADNTVRNPSVIASKSPYLWKSPALEAQRITKPVSRNEKLVYNANSAHSVAFKAIPKQTPELKEPEKVQVKPWSTVPIHEPARISPWQDSQSFVESSESSKILIEDEPELPPAKRACVEPIWSTASENIEEASTSSKDTNLPAAHVWSLNASNDVDDVDDDVQSPSPSDSSVQWETATEPANRPQSACSSILEETPMDLDEGFLQQPEPGPVFINPATFAQWMIKYRVHKGYHDPRTIHVKALKQESKLNKSVLRLANIPKSFNRNDVYKIIRKCTRHAGLEIPSRIACIFVDKDSNPLTNTAYVKWKNEDRVLALKALLLLRRAELTFEGKKLQIAYDNRSIVEWTIDERPMIIGKSGDKKIHERVRGKNLSKINPFYTQDVDYKDQELYGLSNQFLANLDITPPLTNAVTIENVDFDNNEANLRRAFGAAGFIKTFVMKQHDTSRTINIEYDHVLEAVQAVSMFNQQILNGKLLTVTMDKTNPTQNNLFEGITKLGPGLGYNGKPITAVRAMIEIKRTKDIFGQELNRLKQFLYASKSKMSDALAKQEQLERKIKQQNKIIEQHASVTPKESTAVTQTSQNALACISTVIANSIQTNLMSLLGPQIFPQGYAPQNQTPSNAPTWLAQNEAYNWTHAQANAQANYANMQVPQQAYAIPNHVNMQPSVVPMPRTQQIVDTSVPPPGKVQPEYVVQYPPSNPAPASQPPTLVATATVPASTPTFYPPAVTPTVYTPAVTPTAYPPAVTPAVYPPAVTNIGQTNQSKFTSRFDIPPVIPKPQNQGQIQPVPVASVPVKPVPASTLAEYTLEIPLPIAKPQNRGPTKPTVSVKAAPLVKPPPKPASIKINIPSLQVPVTKQDTPSTSQVYTKSSSKALKRKSPPDEPWLKKQLKAMRRNSNSPERSRTHSPRYDKKKDSRRSPDRDYSREREKEPERDLNRYMTSTSVMFKHLPPSVDTEDLKEKMREIGKLVSAKVNSKGQALVKFQHSRDAETCIEMYNKSKVDGQTIEVKWLK